MKIDFASQTPIFVQVQQGLEDEILSGVYREGEQIPSITELAASYKINPATALKGINLLVDAGIVYKRRGIGMFVCDGALQKLKEKRQEEFFTQYVLPCLSGVQPIVRFPSASRASPFTFVISASDALQIILSAASVLSLFTAEAEGIIKDSREKHIKMLINDRIFFFIEHLFFYDVLLKTH